MGVVYILAIVVEHFIIAKAMMVIVSIVLILNVKYVVVNYVTTLDTSMTLFVENVVKFKSNNKNTNKKKQKNN